jgi:hypothetical protein
LYINIIKCNIEPQKSVRVLITILCLQSSAIDLLSQ